MVNLEPRASHRLTNFFASELELHPWPLYALCLSQEPPVDSILFGMGSH